MNANDIWHATLGELQLQMTKVTFDTWVRPSHAIHFDTATSAIQIGVHSPYAKEWLENRLATTIQRTLTGIVGHAVTVDYVVQDKNAPREPSPTADHPPVRQPPARADGPESTQHDLEENDERPRAVDITLLQSPLKPFVMVPKYSLWFWQPLLGCTPFAVYLLLRSIGKEWEGWGKPNRVNIEILALMLGIHRQTITGRKRDQGWLPGAFDALNEHKVAKIVTVGQGRDAVYDARVLHELPMLTPQQFATLPALIQERHTNYLKEFEIDFKAWEQLKFDTLIRL